MLKDDAIYNSSFRFQNIHLNNVNDIYFAINIIIIISTTLFKFFIVVFTFEFIIIIVIDVDVIVIVIVIVLFVIVFERFVFKLIVFDFNIKNYLIMNTSFDKS